MKRVEHLMGTTISLDVPGAPDALGDDLVAWFREVDDRFSTYKSDSEVSTYAGAPSPLMKEVLDRCATLWTQTSGYFDIHATGALDPSGFVKGWSVQVASDRLLAAGYGDHCVNAGGDICVRGRSASGAPWRIGVRHPWIEDQLCCVITGTDLAVATSGVYERGHHVVDPFTAKPPSGLRSVTVVGPDLGDADAYATAALAMGTAGLAWLGTLSGYESAVVTDDRRLFHSPGLPLADG
jgi:thiamine biosynthesis lipoprotein